MKLRALAPAIGLAALAASGASACGRLDSFAFSPRRLDRYTLPDCAPDGTDCVPMDRRVPADLRSEVVLRTSSNVRIYGYWVPRPMAERGSAPTVIYHHGNAANIDEYWRRVSRLWALGANVFVYDYEGYGRSEGSPSEDALFEDGFTATRYVRSITDIDASRIYHYGYSLGGAVATHMAAFAGPSRGLILEATFASAAAIAADSALVVPGSQVTDLRLDTIGKIARAAQSAANGVMLLHGRADDFVQPRYSQDLFDAIVDERGMAITSRRELHWVDGANHGDLPRVAGALYDTWVQAFLMR